MRTMTRINLAAITALAATTLLWAGPAAADEPDFGSADTVRFTIDNPADVGDHNPGDGRCAIAETGAAKKLPAATTTPPKAGSGSIKGLPTLFLPIAPPPPADDTGSCTLRAAVQESSARPTVPHVVTLPSSLGVYRLTEGQLVVDGQLMVIREHGPDTGRAAINAGHKSRIFDVSGSGSHLTVDGLFLAQGLSGSAHRGGDGGAILVGDGGQVELLRSVLVHNRGPVGGAVRVEDGGSLFATWTSFESNVANIAGGAISSDGRVLLDRSSVYDNSAQLGGGLHINTSDGDGFWAVNTSVIDNRADYGGGVYFNSRVFGGMVHSTISGNSAKQGGGYYGHHEAEPLVLGYSILAGNIDTSATGISDTSPDCRGQVSSAAVNLFGAISGFGSGDAECWGYDLGEDLVGTTSRPIDPWLEPAVVSTDANDRGDGGELAHSRPSFRSPALDVVPAGQCGAIDDMIRDDARSGRACDLGAIER